MLVGWFVFACYMKLHVPVLFKVRNRCRAMMCYVSCCPTSAAWTDQLLMHLRACPSVSAEVPTSTAATEVLRHMGVVDDLAAATSRRVAIRKFLASHHRRSSCNAAAPHSSCDVVVPDAAVSPDAWAGVAEAAGRARRGHRHSLEGSVRSSAAYSSASSVNKCPELRWYAQKASDGNALYFSRRRSMQAAEGARPVAPAAPAAAVFFEERAPTAGTGTTDHGGKSCKQR